MVQGQGRSRRTGRPPSQGTAGVGPARPAALRIGLCARLARRTLTCPCSISTLPVVSTNLRNSLCGLARSNPFSRLPNPRYSRSATTVSVRSKSTFSRTSLHRQSRWKKLICSPRLFSTRFLCAVCLDHVPGRQVVAQEERRLFPPQPSHDDLPHRPLVA